MNLELAAITLGTDELAEHFGMIVVGDMWQPVRSVLRLLPPETPRSIRMRRMVPGFLIFFGPSEKIWTALPPRIDPPIEFEYGRMKKFTWISGTGVQVELSPDYVHLGWNSHDWELW